VLYFWIYTSVLGFELPKTALLKKKNAEWSSKIEVLNSQLDRYDVDLEALQMRDDDIYRSIFGMNEIPQEVRNAGFGGVNRYERYDLIDNDGLLKKTAIRLDVLTKKTYVQSRSFEEVALLSKRAGDMAQCILPYLRSIRTGGSTSFPAHSVTGRTLYQAAGPCIKVSILQ
jgi:hypothetical protein